MDSIDPSLRSLTLYDLSYIVLAFLFGSMLPVLVVGAGPVGLLQAYFLSKLGVRVILLERHTAPLLVPKAHFLSPRSLEIFRQFGIPVGKIRTYPTKRKDARWIRFVTDVALSGGREIGCLPFDNVEVDVLNISPEILHNIPQPDLQNLIAGLIEDDGRVDIRRGWTWQSSTETDSEITSIVENTYTGELSSIESSCIIACDGTNSRVRRAAGIELDEEDGPQMMSLHFSADLYPVVKDRTAMLYWIMDPAVQGVVIAYDLGGNQVLLHQYDPSIHSQKSFTPERCRDIIRIALGCEVPFEFHSSDPWKMKSQVARTWSKGKIIVCGDSAHSFPPTGGMGLNSGIADAHNLAWKIAQCQLTPEKHHLSDAIQTYESERRPVALRNCAKAVEYGSKVFGLLKALGTTDPDVKTSRHNMMARLADPAWDVRIAEMVADQADQFDCTNLHIGFVYEPNWTFTAPNIFEPAYRRGARLSHAWVTGMDEQLVGLAKPVDLDYIKDELPRDKLDTWRYSVLDLVPVDSYLLVCSGRAEGEKQNWSRLELEMRRVGAGLRVLQAGVNFTWANSGDGRSWESAYGLDKGGAVLVRPDQHVEAVLSSTEEIDQIFGLIGHSLVDQSCRS